MFYAFVGIGGYFMYSKFVKDSQHQPITDKVRRQIHDSGAILYDVYRGVGSFLTGSGHDTDFVKGGKNAGKSLSLPELQDQFSNMTKGNKKLLHGHMESKSRVMKRTQWAGPPDEKYFKTPYMLSNWYEAASEGRPTYITKVVPVGTQQLRK